MTGAKVGYALRISPASAVVHIRRVRTADDAMRTTNPSNDLTTQPQQCPTKDLSGNAALNRRLPHALTVPHDQNPNHPPANTSPVNRGSALPARANEVITVLRYEMVMLGVAETGGGRL